MYIIAQGPKPDMGMIVCCSMPVIVAMVKGQIVQLCVCKIWQIMKKWLHSKFK